MAKSCPRPLSHTAIQSFIGMVCYCRRFFKGFTSIASPLKTLTLKIYKFESWQSCEKSFQLLKGKLTSILELTLLEVIKGFVVYRYASRVDLGCVIMKHGKDIAYASRQHKLHEQNHPNHDVEVASMVCALKIWRHYLYGVHVDVFADNRSIQYVFPKKI